jgi:hypothetical protein
MNAIVEVIGIVESVLNATKTRSVAMKLSPNSLDPAGKLDLSQ